MITQPDSYLEGAKNKFLDRIYDNDRAGAAAVYEAISNWLHTVKYPLSETQEKYLRQIQAALKQFTPFLVPPGKKDLFFSRKAVQSLIFSNLKKQSKTPDLHCFSDWEKKLQLSSWQMDLIFKTAVTFQMSTGCSNYCRRCNEWALPRVRSHFSHKAVKKILDQLSARGNHDLALYGASDPLDWEDPPHTLATLLSQYKEDNQFSILTKIPRGKEEQIKSLVKNRIGFSVSLTSRNRARIESIEKKLNLRLTKQHALTELLIPACLDEDFTSVKPSITDGYGTEITPEGAFIVIPTFTSAIYPFGHKKISITRETALFPKKKIGRHAMAVDYFKPLEVMGKDKIAFFLDKLIDVQVENILLDNGDYDLTPPGMRSLKEYFEIFEERARLQRKKMTRSVISRLKKKFPAGSSAGYYKNLTKAQKQIFRDSIQAHLDFTRKKSVAQSRAAAASFFLAAIHDFLDQAPVKCRMIRFLLKKEIKESKILDPKVPSGISLFQVFLSKDQGAWKLFRLLLLGLVAGEQNNAVKEFISRHPGLYNAKLDRFIPKAQ